MLLHIVIVFMHCLLFHSISSCVHQYGGLNENGPNRLIGSGTNRRCGLIRGSVSLRVGLEVSTAQARLSLPAV